jgi:hypothetical protein
LQAVSGSSFHIGLLSIDTWLTDEALFNFDTQNIRRQSTLHFLGIWGIAQKTRVQWQPYRSAGLHTSKNVCHINQVSADSLIKMKSAMICLLPGYT